MDKSKAIEKAKVFVLMVNDVIPYNAAYLFGSHVSDRARDDSDIDVGIFTDAMPGDYFESLKRLYSLRRKVDTLIEPHLYITGHDESGFHEEVKKGISLV
ncbi:MAG: nucleotidyltransferase domain-containing protein [Chitinivibrionales bacterium]|nr:nucleotidyltransferase domain-containing protein [Chitinivibrionales bacterium]